MLIKMTTNFDSIAKIVGKRGKQLKASTKLALLRTGLAGVNMIEDRTAKGRSFKGSMFKKYNAQYAAFRSSRGRGTKPNLEFTGRMLGSMSVVSNHKEAEIFFTRGTEAKKAAMNNEKRPFFGFSRNERKKLVSVFERNLK